MIKCEKNRINMRKCKQIQEFLLFYGKNNILIPIKDFEKNGGIDMSDGIRRRDSNTVPLWHRYALTISETAQVFGIGRNQLLDMIKRPDCNYVMYIGRKALIKREAFERYLETAIYL